MLYDLKNEQWERIKDSLPGKEGDSGRSAKDNRKFIAAVMWIGRTGAPWRALPTEYGKWSSVHKRFIRWAKSGVWQMIFNTLAVNEDTEWLMINSTIIRAHQHAAEARKKCGNWYKSWKGGFSSKLHAACDALGNPLKFFVTAGQRSDYTKALDLIDGRRMEALIADKGYDANYMVEAARAVPVIPPRSNKKIPREYDKELHKERNLIERMFKHFRRVATRYSHNFPIFCSHCWHLPLVKINVDTT